MLIPISPFTSLSPTDLLHQLEIDVKACDPGLGVVLADEDRAIGCVHFRLTRCNVERKWHFLINADGTGLTRREGLATRYHDNVADFHRNFLEIIRNGHD